VRNLATLMTFSNSTWTFNNPMLIVLLIGRFFLSGVFLLAGITKLADRPGSRKSLVDFGLPKALAGLGAVLLPSAEIAVGLCLIPARLAWY